MKRRLIVIICATLGAVVLLGGAAWWLLAPMSVQQAVGSVTHATPEAFPVADTAGLSPVQQKIVTLMRQEFNAPHPGSYYAQGADEAWCADFASWIMNQAGIPFRNPNSGSWRIPGVYTLREYFVSQHRFVAAGSDYQPKVGDVVLYETPSPFGDHTNIVVKNDHGTLTTVGGNEPGGIRVHTHTAADHVGVVGFGVLSTTK